MRLIILLLFPTLFWGQNSLQGESLSINENSEFKYHISLDNSSVISALQFDISIDQQAFSFVVNAELTSRASGFVVSTSNPQDNVMRVVVYSSSAAVIGVGTGAILKLNLTSKTLPGDYEFTISNVVMSDDTGALIDASNTSGSVSLRGAQLKVNTTAIDFGRVPIGASSQRSLSVSNHGNEDLIITELVVSNPLSITSILPLTISPGSSQSISIALDSSEKYNASSEVSFITNDNDALRQLQNTTVTAHVYAVNEIHLGTGAGAIHSEVTIPVTINNMEPFSGFQFDLSLPQDIIYVANSVLLSDRKSDHAVSASMINSNTLRVIAYSGSNTNFNGIDGEVMTFKLKPQVSSGTYNLPISNPIISNTTLGNIESDSYNGSIQINAPNLNINSNTIAFGRVPITEERSQTVRLSNNGSASLDVNAIVKDASLFTLDTTAPFSIAQGEFKDITITLNPNANGNVNEAVSVRHNGATAQNIISVTADIFSPNYLKVKNISVDKGMSSHLEIELYNYNIVKGVQFDVTFNSAFNYDLENYTTTDYGSIFNSSTSDLGNNTQRFVLYSTSNNSLSQGNGSLLKIPFEIPEDVAYGNYTVTFSNVVISGPNNTNIASEALSSGKIVVQENLGIDSLNLNTDVYPNPTKGIITLKSNYETFYHVIAMTGEIISDGLLHKGENKLDITHLESGVYSITINTANAMETHKIVKE